MCKRETVTIILVCINLGLIVSAVALDLFGKEEKKAIDLPKIERGENGSFSDAMYKRRSIRKFGPGSPDIEQIAKLMFAAQGITHEKRLRAVPSAGARYPLQVFLLAGSVEGLKTGIYRYDPDRHQLIRTNSLDKRKELAEASLRQMWIANSPAIVIICGIYERVTAKYGRRGRRYTHIEAGCAAQNISLAGFSEGLGSTVVGSFDDDRIGELLDLGRRSSPLIIMPVGPVPSR